MKPGDRVYVAGHRGLAGSSIVRRLERDGFDRLIVRTRGDLDLREHDAVEAFFTEERPEYVFLAAAKVGGILANDTYPADFLRDNLAVQLNVIDAAHRHGVRKLLFLGSSCIYPKHAPQPIKEEYLLTGPLEPTNQAYAIAKIAGIEMCQSYNRQFGTHFISAMPTNLYGPGDNYDLQSSHVLPALIRKIHDAQERGASQVVLWGSGKPRREFMHVADLADACVFLMQRYDGSDIVNVGWGKDISIAELAEVVRDVIGWKGEFVYDATKPDGAPRKLLDVSRINALGWTATIALRDGISDAYESFRSSGRARGIGSAA